MITRLLAQSTVTDLDRARDWYDRVLDRAPDAEPMPGLIEYHLGDAFGLQVWAEPDRAGRSTVVLDESDLDVLADRLAAGGVTDERPADISAGRALQLSDPDGNRVVFTGE